VLEAMQASAARARATAGTGAGAAPEALLPSDTWAFWLRLAAAGLLMMVGFFAWYLHVTRQPAPPLPARAVDTPAQAAAAGAPAVAPAPADGAQALPPHGSAAESEPASAPPATAEAPVQVVEKFYRALAAGDGRAAAALVVPAKRGRGPFNEADMSRFYGSFEEPLSLRSIRPIDERRVEARYSYRVSRSTCEGRAIVETERVAREVLIRRIRANC
jgi:hypothetical protein